MKYNLPTGKVVFISIDEFLDMNDEKFEKELQKKIAWDHGSYINDPFFDREDISLYVESDLYLEEHYYEENWEQEEYDDSLDIDQDLLEE